MAITQRVMIITGPTASGKSARALDVARQHEGWVINADAMQCYKPLPILSAQPTGAEQKEIPHHLYGFADPAENITAAHWVRLAVPVIEAAWRANALPILCGGTGFYLKTLTHGMAELPSIDAAIRTTLQARLNKENLPALYQELQQYDAVLAQRIKPTDTQRILRGLEVYHGTGRALSEWQSMPATSRLSADYEWQVLNPPRAQLWHQIEKRFDEMLQAGVLDEIAAANIPATSSAYKTHGYRELKAYLANEIPMEIARERTILQTRQYAKRQVTWLRGQGLILAPAEQL